MEQYQRVRLQELAYKSVTHCDGHHHLQQNHVLDEILLTHLEAFYLRALRDIERLKEESGTVPGLFRVSTLEFARLVRKVAKVAGQDLNRDKMDIVDMVYLLGLATWNKEDSCVYLMVPTFQVKFFMAELVACMFAETSSRFFRFYWFNRS